MKRPTPIRVGDKFEMGGNVLEVIRVLPGGKLELFDRTNTRFHNRYHREVIDWPRIVPPPMRTNGVPVFAKVMGLAI